MEHYTNHEPDLIPAFRRFSYFWLAFMLLLLALPLLLQESVDLSVLNSGLYAIHAAALAIYLQFTPLRDLLGKWYLPLALLIAVGGVALAQFLSQRAPLTDQSLFAYLIGTLRLVTILVVSAVLVGARYRLRWMFALVMGFTALNILYYVVWMPLPDFTLRLSLTIYYLLMGIIMAAVGYLTWQLSQAERQRRRELERTYTELKQSHGKLTHYASTLEELTISRERNRMARELHDTLAHTLSGLAVQLETARVYASSDASVTQRLIEESVAATRSGLRETRRALQALRASPLEDLGLALALEELAKSAQARTQAQLVLDLPEKPLTLTSPVEQSIYRVAQEALNNVVKHAAARTIKVSLSVGNQLALVIEDDGVGFSANGTSQVGHYGVEGMRERASLANGTVGVESQPGRGTTVTLVI